MSSSDKQPVTWAQLGVLLSFIVVAGSLGYYLGTLSCEDCPPPRYAPVIQNQRDCDVGDIFAGRISSVQVMCSPGPDQLLEE